MPVRWQLNGADSPIAYWLQNQQQHIAHPALPSGENTLRRSDVIPEPLDQNGLTGLIQSCSGGCFSWWGARRMTADQTAWVTSITLGTQAASRWTERTDASDTAPAAATVGSTFIQATAGKNILDFQIGDWTTWPYMTAHRAKSIAFNPSGMINVERVKVTLLGADGAKALILDKTKSDGADVWQMPKGKAKQFMGSWAKEFGAGELLDTYTRHPDRELADDGTEYYGYVSESATGSTTVANQSGLIIRFEIEPTDAASVCKIPIPTLNLPARADYTVVALDAAETVLIAADAPAIRYGIESHWNGFAIVPEGIVSTEMDRQCEWGDWLVWRRLWCEAKAYNDGLTAEMASLSISSEEWTVPKHYWVDPDDQRVTSSYMLGSASGPVGIGQNSYRSVPPMGCFPEGLRTASTGWQPTGTYGAYSYTWGNTRRNHVARSDDDDATLDPQLITGATDELTSSSTAPHDWSVRYHRKPVTGSEAVAWVWKWATKNWVKIRPWRGFVSFAGIAKVLSVYKPLAYAISRSWLHAWGHTDSDNKLVIEWADNKRPPTWTPKSIDQKVESLSMAWIKSSADDYLLIAFVEDSTVKLAKYRIGQTTLYEMTTIGSGKQTAIAIAPNATYFVYRLDGNAIYSRQYSVSGTIMGSEQSTGINDAKDTAGIAVDVGISSDANKLDVRLTYVTTGDSAVVKTSSDGLHFS